MNNQRQQSMIADTFTADIYIAGDLHDIKRCCREFCSRGLCVSITPTDFIYTGGSQTGARVGLINYPKYPTDDLTIKATAIELAEKLVEHCCQLSCSVIFPDVTVTIIGEHS